MGSDSPTVIAGWANKVRRNKGPLLAFIGERPDEDHAPVYLVTDVEALARELVERRMERVMVTTPEGSNRHVDNIVRNLVADLRAAGFTHLGDDTNG